MSDYIIRLIHCFTKFFRKEKQIKAESSSKYSTPLRAPSRIGSSHFRNSDALAPQRATPFPRKVPMSCPIIRCPSQISVRRFGSEDDISYRADNFIRNRPFNNTAKNRIRQPFDCHFEADGSRAKSDDAEPEFPQVPAYKSSKSSLDYFAVAGDRLEPPAKSYEKHFPVKRQFNLRSSQLAHAENRIRQPFDGHLEAELADGSRAKTDDAEPEFPQVPAYKSSKSSLDYFAVAGDRLEPTAKSYEKHFPVKRQFNLRSSQLAHTGFPSKLNPSSSKIPVRNLSRYSMRPNLDFSKWSQRHRGRYTLATHPLHLNDVGDFQGNGDTADNWCFKSSDIGNWIAYRNDTSTRFERMFKALSKKKHTIGNLIDATSHAQWLRLSGIAADRDASMFKQFAGGKVVLTCGEYKFLIDKICQIYDLDYWDVLRKMATFQDEDLQVEDHI